MKLLNRRQLGEKKGLPNSKTHIWRACHNPDPELPFPQPIRIGRNTFWVEEEIDEYLAALAAKRSKGPCGMTGLERPAPPASGNRANRKTDRRDSSGFSQTRTNGLPPG